MCNSVMLLMLCNSVLFAIDVGLFSSIYMLWMLFNSVLYAIDAVCFARLLLCLRKERRTGLPTFYKNALTERTILELYELLFPRTAMEELGGRTTGTLEWREGRGELGRRSFEKSVLVRLSKCNV